MPQYARLILDEAYVSGNIGGVVLAEGSTAPFPGYIEHTTVLDEASKPPIAFFFGESMMGSVVDI
jgi:hypothetical protein